MSIEATPPGELINEELIARGWTRQHFADVTRWTEPFVDHLINGRVRIEPDEASRIGCAFGTSPQFWLNVQVSYDAVAESRKRIGEGENTK